MEIIFGAILSN